MAIPTSQLDTWSTLPSPTSSAHTYAAIKAPLEHAPSLAKYVKDIYLQGSYANSTNIRADSDVDVVVELKSAFQNDTSNLDPIEKQRFHAAYSDATFTLDDFKRDVRAVLDGTFGAGSVTSGNKCLKIVGTSGRLEADVLVCQEHRLWADFPSKSHARAYWGVAFRTADGRHVVNYPKWHRKNGESKQQNTADNYKRTVRTFKNARRKLLEDGLITRDVSPSYFVECLLYNVPDEYFTNDLQDSYVNILIWLADHIPNFPSMMCQNKITMLFGTTPEQWDVGRATRLVTALLTQWNNWS